MCRQLPTRCPSDSESDGSARDLQAFPGDRLDVPVIGPATSTKDLDMRMADAQRPIAQREVVGIASIQFGRAFHFKAASPLPTIFCRPALPVAKPPNARSW